VGCADYEAVVGKVLKQAFIQLNVDQRTVNLLFTQFFDVQDAEEFAAKVVEDSRKAARMAVPKSVC
jgi:hypothetical protein